MTAELQYLSEIAAALKKIFGGGTLSSSAAQGSLNIKGNLDTTGVIRTIEAALLVTEDEQTRSILEDLREALKQELTDAMFVTVGTGSAARQVSLFELMANDIAAI